MFNGKHEKAMKNDKYKKPLLRQTYTDVMF